MTITKKQTNAVQTVISNLYGGDVTCGKVKKLKARPKATKRDVQLANWFINMQNCKR